MDRSAGQVLIFQVGASFYGLNIHQVREVLNWETPTPVPGAPAVVPGVIDLRDRVIPVVDLGLRFRTPRARARAEARIMVTEVGQRLVGLVVDEVTEVRHLRPDDVEPPSPEAVNPRDPLVTGIIRLDGRLAMMIDPQRVLDPAILLTLDDVTGPPAAAAVPDAGR